MRLLVTGASGSGTTTLARALAEHLDAAHFDADDYYWLPTSPPFTASRDPDERLRLLRQGLDSVHSAVVSGSVMGWGLEIEDSFSLIAFLTVPAHVRVERLRVRETALLGHADPAFLEWAAQYDDGPPMGRSLARHRTWLSRRSCAVVHIDGEVAVNDSTTRVVAALAALRST